MILHETFHATHRILERTEAPLHETTKEVYAYLYTWVCGWIFEKLKIKTTMNNKEIKIYA